MTGLQTRTRTLVLTGLAAGGVLLGGLSAWATHDATTIHACAHEKTGALRLVADGTQCGVSEFAVEWAKEGPPGPAGADGVVGYEIVMTEQMFPPAAAFTSSRTAECPGGKRAMGGGIRALYTDKMSGDTIFEGGHEELTVHALGPTADGVGWVADYTATLGDGAGVVGVRVYATCADLAASG